jgi:hypothetical protein
VSECGSRQHEEEEEEFFFFFFVHLFLFQQSRINPKSKSPDEPIVGSDGPRRVRRPFGMLMRWRYDGVVVLSLLMLLAPVAHGANFDHAHCTFLLQDRESQFHKLWGADGWRKREAWRNDPACWEDDGWQFFDNAWWGRDCGRNWYLGTPGMLGMPDGGPDKDWVMPRFTEPAPALLGWDRNINWHCHGTDSNHAEACVKSNVNILSLFGPGAYSVCRNLEWQVCAAMGALPGQGGNTIVFSTAPKSLPQDGGDFPLGGCNSYAPRGCSDGYASGDIFYLEVCMYDAMCSNRDSLWALEAGQPWHCDLDYDGYAFLYDSILDARRRRRAHANNSDPRWPSPHLSFNATHYATHFAAHDTADERLRANASVPADASVPANTSVLASMPDEHR